MKILKTNQLKTVIFAAVKNPCILHGRVFVMFCQESLVIKCFYQHSPSSACEKEHLSVTDKNLNNVPVACILDLHRLCDLGLRPVLFMKN